MRKKPIYLNRMYLLPDGRHFWVIMPHDRTKMRYVGKVMDVNAGPGRFQTEWIKADVLRNCPIVPKGEEPWGVG